MKRGSDKRNWLAMSMLVFYINRAGRNRDPERLETLEQAKDELRELYGKPRKKR